MYLSKSPHTVLPELLREANNPRFAQGLNLEAVNFWIGARLLIFAIDSYFRTRGTSVPPSSGQS